MEAQNARAVLLVVAIEMLHATGKQLAHSLGVEPSTISRALRHARTTDRPPQETADRAFDFFLERTRTVEQNAA